MNHRYKIKWHTKPSPAHTFYDGTKRAWGENDGQAEERAIRELKRVYPHHEIVVDSITREN